MLFGLLIGGNSIHLWEIIDLCYGLCDWCLFEIFRWLYIWQWGFKSLMLYIHSARHTLLTQWGAVDGQCSYINVYAYVNNGARQKNFSNIVMASTILVNIIYNRPRSYRVYYTDISGDLYQGVIDSILMQVVIPIKELSSLLYWYKWWSISRSYWVYYTDISDNLNQGVIEFTTLQHVLYLCFIFL